MRQRARRTARFVTPSQSLRWFSRQYGGPEPQSPRQVQILFSDFVMVSTSACWLSAMFLASVVASGFLPEAISAWAILIAPSWCLIIPSRKVPLAVGAVGLVQRLHLFFGHGAVGAAVMGAFRHFDTTQASSQGFIMSISGCWAPLICLASASISGLMLLLLSTMSLMSTACL